MTLGIRGLTKEELKLLKIKNPTYKWIYEIREGKLNKLKEFDLEEENTSNIKLQVSQMICHLIYSSNTIYKEECYCIIDKIYELLGNQYGFSKELLSLIVVTEVLDYYNAKYDELELLNLYEISPDIYMDLKIRIHEFCKQYYWKQEILV